MIDSVLRLQLCQDVQNADSLRGHSLRGWHQGWIYFTPIDQNFNDFFLRNFITSILERFEIIVISNLRAFLVFDHLNRLV